MLRASSFSLEDGHLSESGIFGLSDMKEAWMVALINYDGKVSCWSLKTYLLTEAS